MTVIFDDTFTEVVSDTTLASHVPDTGLSWTLVWNDGSAPTFTVNAANDDLRGVTANNSGCIYSADVLLGYPSADYDATFTLKASVAFSSRPLYVFVRMTDQENMYAVRLTNVASGGQLYKKVSGTWTALGSAFTCPAAGSVCKLEIIGTALKFYDDGVEVASATDSDLASAGEAGLGLGGGAELVDANDDANSSWQIDTWSVNDLGGGGLSVNKNEAVTVSESTAAAVSAPQVSGSDSIGVTENKELLITSFVDVNDAINVGENSELLITSFVEVNDAIGVAESTAADVSGPQVNASDTISVAESVSLAVVDPGTTNVSVTDAISVAENVAVEVSAPQVGVNDAIGVAENNDLLVTSFVTVSEAITLTDTPSLAVSAPQVNVSDGINVAESVSLDGLLPPPPADSGDVTIYFGQQAYRSDKAKEKKRLKLRREDEELLLLL